MCYLKADHPAARGIDAQDVAANLSDGEAPHLQYRGGGAARRGGVIPKAKGSQYVPLEAQSGPMRVDLLTIPSLRLEYAKCPPPSPCAICLRILTDADHRGRRSSSGSD